MQTTIEILEPGEAGRNANEPFGFLYRLCFIDIEIHRFQELLGDIRGRVSEKFDTGAFWIGCVHCPEITSGALDTDNAREKISHHVDILDDEPHVFKPCPYWSSEV